MNILDLSLAEKTEIYDMVNRLVGAYIYIDDASREAKRIHDEAKDNKMPLREIKKVAKAIAAKKINSLEEDLTATKDLIDLIYEIKCLSVPKSPGGSD